ncbi:MAG: hypothetical protein ACLPKB_22855 [Xanthobacteraceae bacterium]
MKLENLSPVVSVGLSRAIFAGRRAALIFNQGVLTTACVSKSSEVEGFVTIPLEISRSVVALPSQIMQVRINQVSKSNDLVSAEQALLKVQQANLAVLQGGAFQNVSGIPTVTPGPPVLPAAFDLTGAGTPADTGLAPQKDAVDFGDSSVFKGTLAKVCSG